jgi:ribose/xylose/arabinose/galactoside ABC-type transport system permease subunit
MTTSARDRLARLLPSHLSVMGQKLLINVAILAVIWGALAIMSPRFLAFENLMNVSRQIAMLVTVGSVVTILMVTRNFDLSIGGVVALSGCVAAVLVTANVPIPLAFLAGILVGTGVGIANAFLVVAIGINSVVATLGTMYLTRGSALLVTGGVPVYSVPEGYETLGAGYLGPIPIPTAIMLALVVIMTIVERRTWLGKYARATGSHTLSARLAGVPTRNVQLILFILAGTAAGFAGIITGSRVGGGIPTVALGLEFSVVVAAVLGGTSLAGGEGSVIGTFLGAVLVGTLNNGLNLLGVPTFWQTVALGAVLVLAVLLDVMLRRAAARRAVRLRTGAIGIGPADGVGAAS